MGKMRKVNQGTRGNFEDRKRAQVLIFGEKEIKNEIFKRDRFLERTRVLEKMKDFGENNEKPKEISPKISSAGDPG